MSDERSLSDKASVVILSNILTTLIETVYGVVLFVVLSVTEAAVLGLLLLVFNVTKQLAHMGFPDSIFYFFGKLGKGARRGFALQTLAIVGATSLLGAAAILGLAHTAPLWLAKWSPEAVELVRSQLPWLALVAILEFPTWPVPNVMLATDRPRHSAAYNVMMSVMAVAFVLTPGLLGWGLSWVVYGMVAYAAVRFVITMAWMMAILPKERAPMPTGVWREQVAFAMPLGFNAFANRLNKYLDKAVVARMLPESASAFYTLATYDVPFIPAIPMGLGALLITRYIELWTAGKKQETVVLWHKAIHKASLAVLPVSVAAIAVAPDLFPVAIKPEAAGAVLPFQIFCLAMLTRPAKFSAMLQAHGDTRTQFTSTLVSLAVNLSLSIPFTMWFGLAGTATATLIAMIVMRVHVLVVIGRHIETGLRGVMPWGDYLRTLAVAAATGVAVFTLRHLSLPSEASAVGATMVLASYVPIYLGVGWLTGAIRSDDWVSFAYLLRIRRG